MAPPKKSVPASPATLKDVARESGMGTTAVSRFISGKGYVSDEARARIAGAVAKTGYRRNHHASLLKSGDHRQLGLIIGGPDKVRAWTRHFFMGEKFVTVVEEAARQHHELLLLSLAHLDGPEAEATLRRQHFAGAILLDPVPSPLHELLHRIGIPHVLSNFEWGPDLATAWNWSGTGRNGFLTDYGHAIETILSEAKARGYRGVAMDDAMIQVVWNGHGFVTASAAKAGLAFTRLDGMADRLPPGTLALVHRPGLARQLHPLCLKDPGTLGLVTFNLDPSLEDLAVTPAHILQDAEALGRGAVTQLIQWVAARETRPESVYLKPVFVDGGTLSPRR